MTTDRGPTYHGNGPSGTKPPMTGTAAAIGPVERLLARTNELAHGYFDEQIAEARAIDTAIREARAALDDALHMREGRTDRAHAAIAKLDALGRSE